MKLMYHLRLFKAVQNVLTCRTSCILLHKQNFGLRQFSGNSFICQNVFGKRNIHSASSFSKCERWRIHHHVNSRQISTQTQEQKIKNRTVLYYCTGFTILVGGFTYASVLLYRLYCQVTGKGGQAVLEDAGEKVAKMTPDKNRIINVQFNADTNSQMMWNFKPSQRNITVAPGETALAFYTALNPTDKPVTGIATYNVLPYEAGKYFNKIQCFCFEEQQLNPHEEVDMPVFFFLDPEYAEDPKLENINQIVLSYTFFEAKEGLQLPLPSFS